MPRLVAGDKRLTGAQFEAFYMLDADGELHGRWDALTVSQRRAIAALASKHRSDGRAPTRAPARARPVRRSQQAGDIAQDPTAATGWMITDPLMHVWLRRRGRD
jgi:hypothetical protein